MRHYDYLIVGSGLYGATFSYLAKKAGKTVMIIEKRNHTGGNVFCESIEGINVHKYGAHIFHTSNKDVWEFVNLFTQFNRYTNCPIANFHGRLFNLPFNMNTFYQLWGVSTPAEAIAKIEEQRKLCSVSNPKNLEEQALYLCGKDIYETLIKEYTEKQWGRKCTELPAFIIKRLPFRLTFDNNYFNDIYQGIPIGGYNKLITGLVEGIEIQTNIDYFKEKEKWNLIADKIIFTGKIDEFFEYKLGKLEYRTVHFETETINTQNYQGNAVINYTSLDVPYTRIIEHKHFEPENTEVFNSNKTVISKEYSTEWQEGSEPFYPVNDEKNNSLYEKYRILAQNERKVIFGGRLAKYKYFDMDDIIYDCIKDWKSEKNYLI